MRFLLRYVLPLLIALPLAFLLLYPQLLRCMRIGQSAQFGLLPGAGRVYVSHAATAGQRTQLRRHVEAARIRIEQFWGVRRGQPVLIYCPRQVDYERYCAGGNSTFGEGAACSLGTPWGGSYLVLGPEGNNTDVIAHELCHDELFTHLGWWRVKRQIPQWFNEGLALMVDYRFSSPAIWETPDSLADNPFFSPDDAPRMPFDHRTNPLRPMLKLQDLATTRDFFGGNYHHVMRAYQTAADEVTRWLSVVGRAGVPALTRAVANGEPFDSTYRQLERVGRSKKRRF